jgi:transposase
VKPYSLDLRQKIVDAVDSGLTHEEVAARFGVSTDSVSRYHKLWRETGQLNPRPIPGPPPRIPREDYPALAALLDLHHDATLAEHCALWQEAGHALVSPATMCRAQQKLGWTRKKRP